MTGLLAGGTIAISISPLTRGRTHGFLKSVVGGRNCRVGHSTLRLFCRQVRGRLSQKVERLPGLFLSKSRRGGVAGRVIVSLVPQGLRRGVFRLIARILGGGACLTVRVCQSLLLRGRRPVGIGTVLLKRFQLLLRIGLLSGGKCRRASVAGMLGIRPCHIGLTFRRIERLSRGILTSTFRKLIRARCGVGAKRKLGRVRFRLFLVHCTGTVPGR